MLCLMVPFCIAYQLLALDYLVSGSVDGLLQSTPTGIATMLLFDGLLQGDILYELNIA